MSLRPSRPGRLQRPESCPRRCPTGVHVADFGIGPIPDYGPAIHHRGPGGVAGIGSTLRRHHRSGASWARSRAKRARSPNYDDWFKKRSAGLDGAAWGSAISLVLEVVPAIRPDRTLRASQLDLDAGQASPFGAWPPQRSVPRQSRCSVRADPLSGRRRLRKPLFPDHVRKAANGVVRPLPETTATAGLYRHPWQVLGRLIASNRWLCH